MRNWIAAFFTGLVLLSGAYVACAKAPQVKHEPPQPKSGQTVLISAELAGAASLDQCLLEYQIVDPGKYIALEDPDFQSKWTTVKMRENPGTDRQTEGRRLLTAQMPAELQKHRRLVRYRIRAMSSNNLIAPEADDPQPNLAYFVYDGVPAWKGAINPNNVDEKIRQAVVYSSEALQRVPVYHFISSKAAVENTTWFDKKPWRPNEGRNVYKYTGTLVYDGIVYDHVAFRARGGEWRYSMGKNMWKFNFRSGHRFQARDNYGTPYPTKWDKLNLGACIQQGSSGMRGEAGLFEAVGFRLFNLAGVEAPNTHWVHLRIIDEPEENPADQYSGDFWGLYLAVENVDKYFLKEHQLSPGNLYKIEFFQPKTEFNGNPNITDQSDVKQFLGQLMRQMMGRVPAQASASDSWWQENVDLDRYFSYRSIIECIHHYDLDVGKNFFFYKNPESPRWIVLPWDIDLTWGDRMHGQGLEPFYRTGLLLRSPCKEQYQARLAEIRDLLFNPEQVGLLIDEYARVIFDPGGAWSIVDADRAKWDFHPMLGSPLVSRSKAGQGRFYFANPQNRLGVMIDYMKSYAARRGNWIDQMLLADYHPPVAPQIAIENAAEYPRSALKIRIQSKLQTGQKVRWRLAEITDTNRPLVNLRQPWKYEIQEIWGQELNGEQMTIPSHLLVAGHVYRVRARWTDASARWSRWSKPVQFIATDP